MAPSGFGYNAGVSRRLAEKCIRKKRIYRGKAVDFFVDEVRLPNGKSAKREYVDHPGASAIIPFLDKDTILLVRQCRYPIGKITYEIPAGKLDGIEPPLRCAKRELREETGYKAGRVSRLLTFWPAPAFSNELLHIYIGDRLKAVGSALDEDEFLEVVQISFQKALAWITSGKIKDAKTIISLLACALKRAGARTRTLTQTIISKKQSES